MSVRVVFCLWAVKMTSGEKSTPLRGRDRLRNDPQWSPGFLNYCSWMFPEQLRNKSELVGSEETRQALQGTQDT